MILSASRRTDIPAFYSEWFFNRIKEGYVLVRNPINLAQVSKVSLAPNVVDCIVFWTKNPKAIIPYLDTLNEYHYYFQFSLTSYDKDVETNLPDKSELIDTFKNLSDKLGSHRVMWRYDPIAVNEKYTLQYHVENFSKIACMLKGYTEKVTISFIDFYSKIERAMSELKIKEIDLETKHEIAKQFAKIAHKNELIIDTCAEELDLSCYGITKARCIDDKLISRITGCHIDLKKDKSQRPACGCVASIDIGAYNTCGHGCLYCYANCSRPTVEKNMQAHNTFSPLLIGEAAENDKLTEREVKSNKL